MRRSASFAVFIALATSLVLAASAFGAGTVGWSVRAVAEPTYFSPNDALRCQKEQKCDKYELVLLNNGDTPSVGTVTVTDNLPPGITTTETPESWFNPEFERWTCTEGEGQTTVTCTFTGSIPPGGYAPAIGVNVAAPGASMSGSLRNEVTVSDGGATSVVATTAENQISSETPPFGLTEFDLEGHAPGGGTELRAGAHPWTVSTNLETPRIDSPPGAESTGYTPVRNLKSVVVELPVGMVANPQAAKKCTETELREQACPPGSVVGAVSVGAGAFSHGTYLSTPGPFGLVSAIYNMVPEGGYPAELAFAYLGIPIFMYGDIVHTASGYRARLSVPGIPATIEPYGTIMTFYGDPAQMNAEPGETAFLTNPSDCTTEPLAARIEAEAWENPGHTVSQETPVYPQITGCDALQFNPSLSVVPSVTPEGTTQADAPSGYTVDLKLPQTGAFSEVASAQVKRASVTLPEGVGLSPAAAEGLVGCKAMGPEGINIGSGEIGPHQQDLGDPEATELGAGHAGGNGSPYDDGLYHAAPGHCPSGSQIGSVEVKTPLLPEALHGHVYLAEPQCGGEGQDPCREGDATNGRLYGLYLEVSGSGVIIKLKGTLSADPKTGRLTTTFAENPQQPVEDIRLRLDGGQRAALANPQICGTATTTSLLEPWGGPNATPSSEFAVTGCSTPTPFGPGFTAGTATPVADGFAPFKLTLSRKDGEQDLAGVSVTMPPGVSGMLSRVPLCPEQQAQEGTCTEGSRIGTTRVAAGAGSAPLWLSGPVYLTGPYKGAPFGLSIVVPAKAGPFNLGNVIVRSAINVDPHTAQVTVTSDPLPQIRDGVPLRLKTVDVTVDREGFIFNPTNCSQLHVTGAVSGDLPDGSPGATVAVSSPFAVAGCKNLPFHPKFTVLTQAKTSKASGASLHIKVTSGPGQANIGKVKVDLPKQLPSRLTTLQKACPNATFNANPASCPAGSVVGTATAVTPVLRSPLTGPAYLVSHAGAAFPDLVIVLQGEGITLDLVGNTDIKKGVTISTFNSVPDAPISTFDLVLPEGPHSALAANGNLCALAKLVTVRKRVAVRRHGRTVHVVRSVKHRVAESLLMPTTLTGQNGAVIKQTTKIAVSGCAKHKAKKKRKAARKHKKARR